MRYNLGVKKILFLVCLVAVWLATARSAAAQSLGGYEIKNYRVEAIINRDTSVTVKEVIEVDFREKRHGIYRMIPVKYRAEGKKINSQLKVLAVRDEIGREWKYETRRVGENLEIKIGRADLEVTGRQVYVIEYLVKGIIQRYEGHDEFYWNATGGEWDTSIARTEVSVRSEFAKITKVECYGGLSGTGEQKCTKEIESAEVARFESTEGMGNGKELTVVVGLAKENGLVFPGRAERMIWEVVRKLGYVVVMIPAVFFAAVWWKRGRDVKYVGDNVYYAPEEKRTESVSPWARPHLPLVYHPIDNLTPAEVGVLADERVNINDVVAELTELARLKYIKLTRLKEDRLFKDKEEYEIEKLEREEKGLTDYQACILTAIFGEEYRDKSQLIALLSYKDDKRKLGEVTDKIEKGELVYISALKNSFYIELNKIKKVLYGRMAEKKYFYGSPEKVRQRWIIVAVMFLGINIFIVFKVFSGEILMPVFLTFSTTVSMALAVKMPRRAPEGWRLYRQIKGLADYLKKGKWRYEVNEKHLFIEEMLPLAIALGVVKELVDDMKAIGLEPPRYMSGYDYAALTSFRAMSAKAMVSGAKNAGSWTGGSGFGGGGGGGFGGGGGGSW